MTTPLLETRGLRAGYDRLEVLGGVDLSIQPGECLAVLGANGAGKTTLLQALCGLVRPSAGEVVLDGSRVTGRSPEQLVRLGVAHVPQGRKIFPAFTTRRNLEVGAFTRRDRDAAAADVNAMLHRFPEIGRRAEGQAGLLSGGEQQLLAIARALMSRPRLLLLDEPSLGLAPVTVERVVALLAELNAEGMSMLLVEQNVSAALTVAGRACVLVDGRLRPVEAAGDRAIEDLVTRAYFEGGSAAPLTADSGFRVEGRF